MTECTEIVRAFHLPTATSSRKAAKTSANDEYQTNQACLIQPQNDHTDVRKRYKRLGVKVAWQMKLLSRFKLPGWLRQTASCIELYAARGPYGMTIDIRSYRDWPFGAPIIVHAQTGNVSAIQQMFSNGTASPFDMAWLGSTPILEVIQPTLHSQWNYFDVLNSSRSLPWPVRSKFAVY